MRIGSLDLLLTGYEIKDGNYIRNEKYRHLDISFDGEEWEAIFIETLNFPYELIEQYEFKKAMKKYALLGRILDMQEDISYTPDEVRLLSNDCLQVKVIALSPIAQEGLRKLLYGCDEAMRVQYGLLLASD